MARKQYDNPKAEMTPMIDVVFQLMIFFIVTIKQEDIFSKLNANRPAPNASSAQSEENDTQIKIDIGKGGVVFNGRGMARWIPLTGSSCMCSTSATNTRCTTCQSSACNEGRRSPSWKRSTKRK